MEKANSKNIASVINDDDVSDNKKEPTIDPVITPEIPEVQNPTETSKQSGVVYNCLALNVRIEPDVTGKVVAVISKDTKVTISNVASTDLYYNVTLNDGISGYCKKEYIKLN